MFLHLNEGENWEIKVLVIKRQKEEARQAMGIVCIFSREVVFSVLNI